MNLANSAMCSSVLATLFMVVLSVKDVDSLVSGDDYASHLQTLASVNITFYSWSADLPHSEVGEMGRYGLLSRLTPESGFVIHVKAGAATSDSSSVSCIQAPLMQPSAEKWIALIERSTRDSCRLSRTLSTLRNATAVVIYGNLEQSENDVPGQKQQKVDDVVHVYITQQFGERIVSLINNGTRVFMQITPGPAPMNYYSTINKTSMLFLSISFIVLMIISLAWLVFYYVQRSRYTYAKQRLSKRLMSAAKKAISKMPLRTVRSGEDEMDTSFDLCAICIEGYRCSEVVRILPCKHVFHKSCIDPWLIEHRSCPICKIDILKAFGLQVHQSRESVLNVEPDVVSTSYGYSEFVTPDGGIIGRDFDSDGVEIVRFQLAHIEYHPTPSTSTAADVIMGPDQSEQDAVRSSACAPVCTVACTTTTTTASVENAPSCDDVENGSIGDVASDHRRPSSTDTNDDLHSEAAVQTSSIHSTKSEESSEPNETQSLMMETVSKRC